MLTDAAPSSSGEKTEGAETDINDVWTTTSQMG